jgi:hypothetical protein
VNLNNDLSEAVCSVYNPSPTMESTRGLLSSCETSVSLVEMCLMKEDLVERLRNRLESNNLEGGCWNGFVENAVPGLAGN